MLSSTDQPQPLKIPPAGGEGDTPWPLLIAAMLLIVLPVLAISQVAAHFRTDVVDDQLFGYFGWRIAHGATAYLDVWDNKPPGIYWINALGFLISGDRYAGVIALVITALIVAHVCVFVISASVYFRGAAAIVTILAGFYITHSYYQGGTNRTETFLVPCELAAVAFYARGFARDRWWCWLASGMCCGLAFLFKQVGLAAWGAMGLHLILLTLFRDLGWRDMLRRGLLLAGGLGAVVGIAAVVLVAQGALGEAIFAIFGFNRAYFEESRSSLTVSFANYYLLRNELLPVMLLPILMAGTGLFHALVWWIKPAFRPADVHKPLRDFGPVMPRYMVLFFIWWAVSAYGAMVSPHSFRHYLIPTFPPLILMAGYLVNVIKTEVGLLRRMAQRAWVAAAFVIIGYFATTGLWYHWEGVAQVLVSRQIEWAGGAFRFRPSESELVSRAVERLSLPEERLQCWGYMPGVYLQTRRINACRYVTTEKIGQLPKSTDSMRRELQDALHVNPPAIFALRGDEHAYIIFPDPNRKIEDWLEAWLAGWLTENYRLVADVYEANAFVFRRKDLPLPPGAAPEIAEPQGALETESSAERSSN